MHNFFVLINTIMYVYGWGKTSLNTIDINLSNSREIDEYHEVINFEEYDIFKPGLIESLSDNKLLVFDFANHKFHLFNENGVKEIDFGRNGRGPGEFIFPQKVLELEEKIYIADYARSKIIVFDLGGNFLFEYPYDSKLSRGEVTFLEDSIYYSPTNGKNSSLIAKINRISGDKEYLGSPRKAETKEQNEEDSYLEFTSGNLSATMKNSIFIESSSNHLFVYYLYLSELESYDKDGSLKWSKKLNLPANPKILEQAIEVAKHVKLVPIFNYIWRMKGYGEDIYIQTVPVPDVPAIIVKVNKEGNLVEAYTFPFIDNKNSALISFAVNSSMETIFIIDLSQNKLFEAKID